MKQKGLAQVMVTAACALATCMPCGAALAAEQVGTGVIDVTVRQVVSADEPGNDNNETDSSSDTNVSTTPEALSNARKVAKGNTWAVAPISGGAVNGKSPTRASALPLAKTSDDNLAGIAAIVGGFGAGFGTMAFMLRSRDDKDKNKNKSKNEDKGTGNEEN